IGDGPAVLRDRARKNVRAAGGRSCFYRRTVYADCSVELAPNDDALELPWSSPDGATRYYDLKRRPELLLEVGEAHDNRELGEFLVSVNSNVSVLETAKCDTWISNELAEEEKIYGAA